MLHQLTLIYWYIKCIDFDVSNNDKDPKSKVNGLVRISDCKAFEKDCTPNWWKEVKNRLPWTCFIEEFYVEEIIGNIYEKE